jgi:hypothetical protein
MLATASARSTTAYSPAWSTARNDENGQLLALSRINDENGAAYLSDEEVETVAQSTQPTIAPGKLVNLFNILHLGTSAFHLPRFTRRLRAFKAERGL